MPPDDSKLPPDPTAIVGSATDISPLTHAGPKPPHERTAAEEAGAINWEAIAASARFRTLLRAKRRFIIPAMIFFIVYYFALPVLVGYARPLMEKARSRAGEPRLSLRAFAVLHGLDHRRALRPRRERFDRQAREIIKENPPRDDVISCSCS